MDNIKECTCLPVPDLFTRASCRKDWKRISAESSLMSPPPLDDPIGKGAKLNRLHAMLFPEMWQNYRKYGFPFPVYYL